MTTVLLRNTRAAKRSFPGGSPRSPIGQAGQRSPFIRVAAICLLLGLFSVPGIAKEGGDQYPNGAENWFAGAVPGYGTYFINYLGHYGGTLRTGSGDEANLGGSTPSVGAYFDAVRIVQVTDRKFLGAIWALHVIAPFVEQSMDLGGRRSQFGMGDLIVDPVILGWHGEHYHVATGVDIALPTGHYNADIPQESIGAGYYSFEPLVALTYQFKGGWETSAKMMYNLKTANSTTDYHSGQEFHMDYVVGKHLGPLSVGVSGYAVKQITNDTVAGETVAANGLWSHGRKGHALAIGPSVNYTTKNHITLIAQWQHETLVRNRFGGDKLWFKMILRL